MGIGKLKIPNRCIQDFIWIDGEFWEDMQICVVEIGSEPIPVELYGDHRTSVSNIIYTAAELFRLNVVV